MLRHGRRRLVRFNVAPHPSARWTSQQIRKAFPCDQAPKYLLRDRDSIYGERVVERVRHMGVKEVLIALSEKHLHRISIQYVRRYNESRTHLLLERNSPGPRKVEPPAKGKVVAVRADTLDITPMFMGDDAPAGGDIDPDI